jgi:hypothetical protein
VLQGESKAALGTPQKWSSFIVTRYPVARRRVAAFPSRGIAVLVVSSTFGSSTFGSSTFGSSAHVKTESFAGEDFFTEDCG